ncbi:hypothetical protein HW115_06470 [Verrucomicrobiaceae bacterium N1E253]|uniref:Uncharacterized protein n=1 Tax=Oceaniferula marina TaxID=2748318 RepID=A0A851GJG5_9BACT|nr:hypothetical protein [Oceaniferula marina]NWK55247.1 hypothetical protein [Oceaniferula marina]
MKVLTQSNKALNGKSQTTHNEKIINLLLSDGLENSLSKIAELFLNAAMLLERIHHIGAGPYERNAEQRTANACDTLNSQIKRRTRVPQ